MISFVSIKVLVRLMDGKLHSASELSHENEVSTKTISRAIMTLMEAGVSVETKLGRFGGYYLSKSSIPQLLNIDDKNLSQMLSLAEHTRNILKTETTPLEETIINSTPKNRVKSVLTLSSKIILDSKPWGNTNIDNTKFDRIYEACINNHNIEFDYISYNSKISHRSFSPYCMTLKNGTWYSYGMCNNSKKLKLFKLSRMSNITITQTQFSQIEIDLKNKPWNNMDSFNEIEIEVEIPHHFIDEIKEWLPLSIIKKNESHVIASATVIENDNLYNKLIEDFSKIKLLSPKSLVTKLVQKCRTIENLYA